MAQADRQPRILRRPEAAPTARDGPPAVAGPQSPSRRGSPPLFGTRPLRDALAVSLTVVLAACLSGANLHHRAGEVCREHIRGSLAHCAQAVAALIDVELHRTLTRPEQTYGEVYEHAVAPLRRVLHGVDGLRFVYTVILDEGQVYFVLDGTPAGDADGDGVEDHSGVMERYDDPDPAMLAALREGRPTATTSPYQDAWGSLMSGYAPFHDSEGRVAGVVGVDITATEYAQRLASIRRAAFWGLVPALVAGALAGGVTYRLRRRAQRLECRLRQQADELEAMLDSSPVATVVVDAGARRIIRVNQAALAMTGQAAEDLLGHSCKRYSCSVPGDHCPVAGGDGRPICCDGVLVARDGREVHFLKHAVPAVIHGRACVLETFTDVTELKRMQERLSEGEIEYRTITACAQDAIITADAAGTIHFWNAAAQRIFGFTAAEVCGRSMLETIVPRQYHDAKRRGLTEFARTGQGAAIGQTLELTALRKDGGEFPIEISVSAYRTAQGPVAVATIRDISDRKASEAQTQVFSRQQAALNAVFEIGLQDIELREMLERCLDEVLFNTWLALSPRGAIFLVEDDPALLVLQAHRNLAGPLLTACARVPIGRCLCGRAAADGRVVFADHVDQRHETRFEGMPPHGHYCVPIRVGERVLGVLVVYVNEGHVYSELEEDFLQAVGNAIAGLVERKRTQTSLREEAQLARLRGDIGAALGGAGNLGEILRACCEAVVRHLDAAFARVWTLNVHEQVLELQASAGLYAHIDGRHARIGVGEFKIGRIAASRRPHLNNDVPNDPQVGDREWAAREHMVAFAGYPLVVADRLLGVVALFARRPLSTTVLRALESIAGNVALGIQRKWTEIELERTHRQLLETSRQAGMAEVATGVLHNVGNVLNSINVSASLAAGKIRQSRVGQLAKAADLLAQHRDDLGTFIMEDAKGKLLPGYLAQLAEYLAAEQTAVVTELEALTANVEHVKKIVSTQQAYACVSGVCETVRLADVLEDALKINASALDRHGVDVQREYADVPEVTLDKHKLMQILVNLLRNAKYAMSETGQADRHLTVRLGPSTEGRIRIDIVDNGVGIPAENLTRIFAHGFTTRKDGHGFGLHSSALAARELGGRLSAHSDGPGRGATFTLELPGPSTETSP